MFHMASEQPSSLTKSPTHMKGAQQIKTIVSCDSVLLITGCRVNNGWRTRSEGPTRPLQWVLCVQQIAGTALQVALLHVCFCNRLLLSGLDPSAAAERL